MPLAEVIIAGDVVGQQWVKRLNYEVLFALTPFSFSSSLVTQIMDDAADPGTPGAGGLIAKLLAMMSQSVTITAITARDVYSVTDFYTRVVSLEGGIVSTPISTFNAFGFQTDRTRSDIRRGAARFPGPITTQIENSGNFNAATRTLMGAVAAELSAQQTLASGVNSAVANPVVVSKQKYYPGCDPDNVPCEPGKKPAYRYYDTWEQQELHIMRDITWSPVYEMTTQNSRKVGRGG